MSLVKKSNSRRKSNTFIRKFVLCHKNHLSMRIIPQIS